MSKLSIYNMAFGFWLLFLAAAAGAFIATDLTAGYIAESGFRETWAMMLTKSAHGHTNLFALLHIAFGLTLPYSTLPLKWKIAQTFGLMCGAVAMGIGLLIRASKPPSNETDLVGICVGILLSAALAAIFTHATGLTAKALKRS
ncbi:MAG: hypothetical protein NTY08_03315 [Proteobacteria bacterium]|nr:hypothetical protein [Pseudomonadota bacterium]